MFATKKLFGDYLVVPSKIGIGTHGPTDFLVGQKLIRFAYDNNKPRYKDTMNRGGTPNNDMMRL